jgi:hypothetical protein
MTLANGALKWTGSFSETVGALTLSANSEIDLGFTSGILRFAASNLSTWTGTLSIYNWSGNPAGGGTDQVFFGSNSSGLTSGQLGQINFYSGTTVGSFLGTAKFTGTGDGEIVPVPEPTAVGVALGVLGLIGWRERRRLRGNIETTAIG